jgi:hypothetical protein
MSGVFPFVALRLKIMNYVLLFFHRYKDLRNSLYAKCYAPTV